MKGQKQKNEKVNGNDTMRASEKCRQKCEEGIKAIEWRKKKESEGGV